MLLMLFPKRGKQWYSKLLTWFLVYHLGEEIHVSKNYGSKKNLRMRFRL